MNVYFLLYIYLYYDLWTFLQLQYRPITFIGHIKVDLLSPMVKSKCLLVRYHTHEAFINYTYTWLYNINWLYISYMLYQTHSSSNYVLMAWIVSWNILPEIINISFKTDQNLSILCSIDLFIIKDKVIKLPRHN